MEEDDTGLTPEQKIEAFVSNEFNLEIYNSITNTLYDAPISIVVMLLDHVLEMARTVFCRSDEPFNLINWIMCSLSVYPPKSQKWIVELVFRITDERIEDKTIHYSLIKSSVLKMNFTDNVPGKVSFDGFKNHLLVKKYLEGDFSVRGYLMKKKDIVKNYLKENEVIIRELQKENFSEVKELSENTIKLISALLEYRFSGFLTEKKIDEDLIYRLIEEYSGKHQMPFTIALLHEVGFLKYFFEEFAKTRIEGVKMLSKVFDVNERRIKGNINVLNPNSSEDGLQYTSHQYTSIIQKKLKGL